MDWRQFGLIHLWTVDALRKRWFIAPAIIVIQAALAVQYGTGVMTLLAHVVSTPLLLYLAIRSVVPRPERETRAAIYDVLLAPFWSLALTITATLVLLGFFVALGAALTFFPFGVAFILLAWPAWIVALIVLGFGLSTAAANNWDGFAEEWSRSARQRRWLVVRMAAVPTPILLSAVVVAGLSGYYGSTSGAVPMSDSYRTVLGLMVLSIQTYGIVSAGVLLAQAYLREFDATAETVEVFV